MSREKQKTPEARARASFPVVESMGQASALLGCPLALLKSAKRNGCRAFLTHGRIDLGLLSPFLWKMAEAVSDLPAGFSSWGEALEAEKARREAIKRQREEELTMLVSDAVRLNAEAMSMTFAELERRDRELPPALAGLSAIEISKRMKSDTELIRKNLREKFEMKNAK